MMHKHNPQVRKALGLLISLSMTVSMMACSAKSDTADTKDPVSVTEQAALDSTQEIIDTPADLTTAPADSASSGNYITVDGDRYTNYIADDYTVQSDIIYAAKTGNDGQSEDLGLDIYTAANDQETKRPAIIFAHGGGLTKGDKANESIIKDLAIDFAKMGYVSVVVNYRLAKEANQTVMENAMDDIESSILWVDENANTYGIDNERIALLGYSAGSNLVINLCYCDLPTEFAMDHILGVIDMSGSPLYYGMSNDTLPPCLILHGTADTTASFNNSQSVYNMLTQYNADVTLHPLEGLNHDLMSRFEEIRNSVATFLYQRLTGKEVEVSLKSEISPEYQRVLDRMNNSISYHVKQVDCTIDGSLDEWKDFDQIQMNELRDAGDVVPELSDYEGYAMLGWDKQNPTYLYVAAVVTDDVIQDIEPANSKWYLNDCLEIVIDPSANLSAEMLLKWCVNATGNKLSVCANEDTTKVAVSKDGNTTTYELCIDVSQLPSGSLVGISEVRFSEETSVGFSISYNDCENGVREHQMGWTAGKSADRSSIGTLYFN